MFADHCFLIIDVAFWNKNIFGFSNDCFGLDLSDYSAKIFQFEKNGSAYKIRGFGAGKISPGLIQDGKILDKAKVSAFISEILRRSGPKKISTKKVICSLPESKVFLRILSIPDISEEEAANAVKWEVEASIPLTIDQVYYDWQIIGKNGGKMDLLTVAVAKETVDDLAEVLESAGLTVYGFEMESIASSRSLIPENTDSKEIFLIIDIGEEKTSFIITQGNVPHFTSSIPFSSSGITEQLASVMSISADEAEKIKIERGIGEISQNDPIFKSVHPLLENLSVEIEKTVDFYQEINKNSPKIEKIIISGGGANLKGIIGYFETRLGKRVALGNPWVGLNMGGKLPVISKENSVRYATAIGLAIRGVNYEY